MVLYGNGLKPLARPVFFNSLPKHNFLDLTKFKAFADDKLDVVKLMISVFDKVKNIVGKGENAATVIIIKICNADMSAILNLFLADG